jgi:hypothetical protein
MKHILLLRARLVGLRHAPVALMLAGMVSWTVGQRSSTLDESVQQLKDAGRRIATAVLKHDVETLLAYDRPDLRADDRSKLQDSKSDLYCQIFDRTCDPTGRASVYDILSGANRLDIEVQVLRARGQPLHGLILFFDATKVPKAKLRSPSFLCELSRHDQIVSWMFKLDEKGQWVSAHPPFDIATDSLC